jgi:hypothetical protein
VDTPTPLSSNEKALAISVLVMGALVVLFSITTLVGAGYVLTTGKVMGADMSRSFAKLGGQNKDQRIDDMMDRQLATQAEVQKKWAPAQLGTGGVYLLAVGAAMVFAIMALARGRARRQLGQVALLAAAVRIAEGVVTFMLTNELMRGVTDSIMTGMPNRGGDPEKLERVRGITSSAMAGLSAVSAGCMTFLMVGYFALVAYVFLVHKKQEPPLPS